MLTSTVSIFKRLLVAGSAASFLLAAFLFIAPPRLTACNEPLICTMEVVQYGCQSADDCACTYQCYFENGFCLDTMELTWWSQCGGGSCNCVGG